MAEDRKAFPKKREAVVDLAQAQEQTEPVSAVAPAPKARPTTKPHHTRCKVVGTSVVASDGRMYPEGHEGEFADADVLSLPHALKPLD